MLLRLFIIPLTGGPDQASRVADPDQYLEGLAVSLEFSSHLFANSQPIKLAGPFLTNSRDAARRSSQRCPRFQRNRRVTHRRSNQYSQVGRAVVITSGSRTVGFKSDGIVYRIRKVLLAAQVALSGFDGNVPEEKLYLFELTSCLMA